MNGRKALFLAAPVLGLALLGLLVVLRRPEPEPAAAPKTPSRLLLPRGPLTAAVPENPPPLAPAGSVAAAMDEAAQRGTFLNYRAAVASKNRPLQDVLRPLLMKNRAQYVRLGREEADRSTTPQDREMTLAALQTLED